MAHTVNLFSHVALRNLELMGKRPTLQECSDYHHLWRYTGWLLGTDENLLTETYEDEVLLYNSLATFYRIPNQATKILVDGLVAAVARQPPFFHSQDYMRAISRYLVGDSLSDQLKDSLPEVSKNYQQIFEDPSRLHFVF